MLIECWGSEGGGSGSVMVGSVSGWLVMGVVGEWELAGCVLD